MLEGLKDENGQIKKPVLFSLLGAGGLVAYLVLKGGGLSSGSSSTGQTTPLTPDLSALQQAIQGVASNPPPTTPPGGGASQPPTGFIGAIPGHGSRGGSSARYPTTHKATIADLLARLDLHQLHVYNKQGMAALIPLLDTSQLHLLHLINTGGTVTSYTGTGSGGTIMHPGESGNAGGGGGGLATIVHPVASSFAQVGISRNPVSSTSRSLVSR